MGTEASKSHPSNTNDPPAQQQQPQQGTAKISPQSDEKTTTTPAADQNTKDNNNVFVFERFNSSDSLKMSDKDNKKSARRAVASDLDILDLDESFDDSPE